jgi:hypothetical protein
VISIFFNSFNLVSLRKVRQKINDFFTVDLVKSGSEELLKIIKETTCHKVLVDNRKVSGLTDMAVIMSDNIFTQLSLQGFAKVRKVFIRLTFSMRKLLPESG